VLAVVHDARRWLLEEEKGGARAMCAAQPCINRGREAAANERRVRGSVGLDRDPREAHKRRGQPMDRSELDRSWMR
jgi:hypothetical protein